MVAYNQCTVMAVGHVGRWGSSPGSWGSATPVRRIWDDTMGGGGEVDEFRRLCLPLLRFCPRGLRC